MVAEVAEIACIALGKVRDEHVEALVTEALVPRFREEPISPLLGGLLAEMLRDNVHHGLVELFLEELHDWLEANPRTVQDVIGERAPWWAPDSLNERVTAPRAPGVVRWVADIRADPNHRARSRSTRCCARLADDLLDRPRHPGARRTAQGPAAGPPGGRHLRHLAVERAAAALTASLADPEGAVRRGLLTEVDRVRRTARRRRGAARAAGRMAADAAVFVVERYGSELTAVITHTIERWDGKEAAGASSCTSVGPAVHPDQRHHRRRPGRRADPHDLGALADRCREAAGQWAMADPMNVAIDDESIKLGQFLKLANLVESGCEAKEVLAGAWSRSTARSRPGAAGSWSTVTWSRSQPSRRGSPTAARPTTSPGDEP